MSTSSYQQYVKDYAPCARCGTQRPATSLKPNICEDLDFCYQAFVRANKLEGASVEVVEGVIRERTAAQEALRRLGADRKPEAEPGKE